MKTNFSKPLIIFLIGVSTFSCSEFNQVMKSKDNTFKKNKAVEYFETKSYTNAAALLEDVIPFYKLSMEGEKLYYYYCMSNYYLKDYISASYYFRRFINQYPSSKFAEECQFLSAMCSVHNSPHYSLDQTETLNALDQLQIFVDMHPKSMLLDSCNGIMDKLNHKLELKQFEAAKLYFNTENYKASMSSLSSHLDDYPNSTYKQETMYLIVKSNYKLAINSIESKKLNRLKDTIKSYRKFVANFPNSEHVKELASLEERVEKEINLTKASNK